MKRASFAATTLSILIFTAVAVWIPFSWLACEAMGAMHPGKYVLCAEVYGTVQEYADD